MKRTKWRPLVVSAILLLVVYYSTAMVVKRYRAPGSMTVIEAQSMDMGAMSATTPVGSLPVAAETVERTEFAPTVTYTGSVVAYNDMDIYPRVTGVLTAVTVYPGDRVRAGQVVARLDSAELSSRANEAAAERTVMEHDVTVASEEQQMAVQQARSTGAKADAARSAVAQAQSQITLAEAAKDEALRNHDAANGTLADAQSNVSAARSDADYWHGEIAREAQLFKAKAVSRDEFDKETSEAKAADSRLRQAEAGVTEKSAMLAAAAARVREADASVTAARAQLAQARAAVVSAEADVAAASTNRTAVGHRVMHHQALVALSEAQQHTADIVRDYTQIRAERDGVVTERLVSPGTLVQPGMAILRIKSDTRVRLQANVAEGDLTGIRVGSRVTVTLPRDPSFHLTTRITSLFSAANAQTRTITVEAIVPNPGGKLLAGEYIVMSIATASPREVLTAPTEAIQRDVDQKPFVWAIAEAAAPGGKTLYTCLMHPQVVVDHPGKCPICSMTLVPKNKTGKYIAHRVMVALGDSDGKQTVVESGLEDGQQVIYRGQDSLNEGDPVAPVPWSSAGPRALPELTGTPASMSGMDMSGGKAMPKPAAHDSGSMADMPGMNGK